MNWFGILTMFAMFGAIVGRITYEIGYEEAVKDLNK